MYAWQAVVVDTSGGDVRDVALHLEPGTTGAFEGDADDPGLLLEVRDSAGLPLIARRPWFAKPFEALLAPGTYMVSVYDDATVVRRRRLTVGTQPMIVGVME
jgi:hypothetical protein